MSLINTPVFEKARFGPGGRIPLWWILSDFEALVGVGPVPEGGAGEVVLPRVFGYGEARGPEPLGGLHPLPVVVVLLCHKTNPSVACGGSMDRDGLRR